MEQWSPAAAPVRRTRFRRGAPDTANATERSTSSVRPRSISAARRPATIFSIASACSGSPSAIGFRSRAASRPSAWPALPFNGNAAKESMPRAENTLSSANCDETPVAMYWNERPTTIAQGEPASGIVEVAQHLAIEAHGQCAQRGLRVVGERSDHDTGRPAGWRRVPAPALRTGRDRRDGPPPGQRGAAPAPGLRRWPRSRAVQASTCSWPQSKTAPQRCGSTISRRIHRRYKPVSSRRRVGDNGKKAATNRSACDTRPIPAPVNLAHPLNDSGISPRSHHVRPAFLPVAQDRRR